MKTVIGYLAVFGMLTSAGCTTGPETADVGCEYNDIETVKVSYKKNSKMSVSKEEVEVFAGDLLHFRLIGNSVRTVKIVGTNTRDKWLDATGPGDSSAKDRHIYICVENSKVSRDPYTYEVVVDGVGRLDPAVRVRN